MDPIQLSEQEQAEALSYEAFREAVIKDYTLAHQSRQASLLGRKEVLTGKAKFGIFGDGKEVPQVAMAKFFRPGDFYAGYYRDQTFAFASGAATIQQFFSQLYADPDPANDPHSAGRNMNNHFGSQFLNKEGEFVGLSERKNLANGMAPTAGHMPKALGLAYASKLFRNVDVLKDLHQFSNNGDEVCFCTIGDASTSEGHFWETMNAAAVSQVPLAVFVWDDGYGISVPKEFQTVKASISDALSGFEKERGTNGMLIYKVKGWDYAQMCEVFEEGISIARKEHVPVLFHVDELTQPQGHSTSGSHERYKSPERLQWEREWDCLVKMRNWIMDNGLLSVDEMEELEEQSRKYVSECRVQTWRMYEDPILEQKKHVLELISDLAAKVETSKLSDVYQELSVNPVPFRRDIMSAVFRAIQYAGNSPQASELKNYYLELKQINKGLFNSHLHLNEELAPNASLPEIQYDEESPNLNGYEILNRYFDALFSADSRVVAFGEDVGKIGDVNQGFAGLQAKYGKNRIFDTGIRELTIIGQGVGMAMRGLRPIAEIQYLDYLLYGLTVLSDDAASLHYRSAGTQVAPIIVRTRGHRLEGIWHSGSPMGLLINALKGFRLCVPRNMVQAVGFYNALLAEKEPGVVIESLNGYRLKEKLPSSLLDYILPYGVPEIMREGTDLTIVSYGSTLRIVQEAAEMLAELNVSAEILDVQTLMPFDVQNRILESLKKTNRIIFVDEDVPGGATSFMYADVMDRQGGYRWLDAAARILCAHPHRPSYGSDGDYFSKPNVEDIVSLALEVMAE